MSKFLCPIAFAYVFSCPWISHACRKCMCRPYGTRSMCHFQKSLTARDTSKITVEAYEDLDPQVPDQDQAMNLLLEENSRLLRALKWFFQFKHRSRNVNSLEKNVFMSKCVQPPPKNPHIILDNKKTATETKYSSLLTYCFLFFLSFIEA